MTHATGISTRHYVTGYQSDFETPAVPSGSNAVRLKSAIVFDKTQNAETRDDYHPGTRDALEDVPLDTQCRWSATAYVLGASTQGGFPDLDSLYQTAFSGAATTATTVAGSPTPTTTQFKLVDDNLVVGDIAKIDVEDASGQVIEKRYFQVAEKDGSDVLTIHPPLDNAPCAGDAVKAVANYRLAVSSANAVTAYRSDNLIGEMGIGCKGHLFTFKFAKGQPGELILEGQCRDVIRSIHTTLDGGIDDSQTSVDVALAGIEVGAIVSCEDELMQVSGIDADGKGLTIVRGANATTPAAHGDGCAIGPYEPTESTSGSPIRGLFGGVWLGNSGVFIKADEVSVQIDEQTIYPGHLGDGGKAGWAFNPENRKVSWSVICYLDPTVARQVQMITANSPLKVFFQAGRDDGRGCAISSSKVQFHVPEIPDSKGEPVKVTLESRAVLGTSGEDSIRFAF